MKNKGEGVEDVAFSDGICAWILTLFTTRHP